MRVSVQEDVGRFQIAVYRVAVLQVEHSSTDIHTCLDDQDLK